MLKFDYTTIPTSMGGKFKNSDNVITVITETDANGHSKVGFQPMPAFETPEAVETNDLGKMSRYQ